MITICLTYFKSLSVANLRAALYSVRQQDFSQVDAIVVVDNATEDASCALRETIDALEFLVPVTLVSSKHGDSTKTHAWSTNVALSHAKTPWVVFTRADYLLDFGLVEKFVEATRQRPPAWDGFITSNGRHLSMDVTVCEATGWRARGPSVLDGTDYDYTTIDAGVWMARRASCARVGGLDERLTAWGHAQTRFQYLLHTSGVEFLRLPETLFFHPRHAAPRDLALAHEQLRSLSGPSLQSMWSRYEGASPY